MNESNKLLKMRELAEITGVSGATIRYYIREGILPQPIRTHRNMAYYDESYVRRVKLIKELQEKRYLPLNIIKKVMEESEEPIGSDEIKTILAVEGKLFKNISALPEFRPLSRQDLSERTGVDIGDIERLEAIGFISAQDGGTYDEDNVRIVELCAQFRSAGFTLENGFELEVLEIYKELVEVLAKKDVEIFTTRITRAGIPPERATKMAEDGINILNSIIGVLRKRLILKILRDYHARASAGEVSEGDGEVL